MRKFLIVIILTFAVAAVARGQANENPACPNTIALDGGPFGLDIGALVRYSVKVDTGGRHFDLTYNWSASTPEYGDGDPRKIRQIEVPIEKGQGTDEVEVRLPGSYLDIKVIIGGLPSGCPNELTGSTVLDKGPPAHKVGEITATDPAEDLLADIAQQTKENPNHELYIISGHFGERASAAVLAREKKIVRDLLKKGVDQRQIMMAGVNAKVESVQFWLVPPGAANPDCEKCEEFKAIDKNDCPTITVNGPAGILDPGEVVSFTGEVSGDIPPNVTYVWTVSEGEIASGQNTLSVGVRLPKDCRDGNVIASLEIRGLPEGCPKTASGAFSESIDPGPLLVDQYGAIALQDEHAHLKAAVSQLKKDPNSMLWIVFYPTGSDASIKKKKRSLSDYLTKVQHIGELFKIVVGPNIGMIQTKIYLVPPGVDDPQP